MARDAAMPNEARKAAAELRAEGIDVQALQLDVTSDASVTEAAAAFGKAGDQLDVLVNNAGVCHSAGTLRPTQTKMDDMHALYEVNVFGPVRVTQAFVPPSSSSPVRGAS